MPPSRSTSTTSSTASGLNFKKNVPFKPPGPAKSASGSTPSSGLKRTASTTSLSRSKGKAQSRTSPGPDVLRPSSSEGSISSEDDFGTTIDIDIDDHAFSAPDPVIPTNDKGKGRDITIPTLSDSEDDEPFEVQLDPQPQTQKQDKFDTDEIPGIPANLLARLLHENFMDKSLGVSASGISVLGRYVDVFVREAVARAAEARKDKDGDVEGEVWLDVPDLERVVPGLLLDF